MVDMKRDNTFGLLRLLFATLVIVSHASTIVDGNGLREPLAWILPARSLGDLAVDGFFLISGYLVTKSFFSSSPCGFLMKRLLRIYPGFCAAWLVCMLVVAPYSGAVVWHLSAGQYAWLLFSMLSLQAPFYPGAFHALHCPYLNVPMWTIGYEFRCYLLVALAGMSGILLRPRWFLVLVAALFLGWVLENNGFLHAGYSNPILKSVVSTVFIVPDPFCRLASVFTIGACFFLFREQIPFNYRLSAVCLAGAAAWLFIPGVAQAYAAEYGLVIFGSYLIFFFAFGVKAPWLRAINSGTDISYGVYLYGWPLSSLIVLHDPGISPWILALATLPLAGLAGYASWHLVENPALSLKRYFGGRLGLLTGPDDAVHP